MAIGIGQQAPDFALKGIQGDAPVRLADFQGKKNVVLLFFPLAFSPVCTTEMCSLRDSYTQYGQLSAEVLGLSIDSPFALAAWARQEGLPFNLLSDFNRTVSRQYDVLYEDLMGLQGVAKRAAFVVDKQGTIRYAEVCPTPRELPNFEAIQSTLKSLA